MSLREFLLYEHGIKIEPLTLEEVLKNHVGIAAEIGRQIRPLAVLREYLKYGYFPYYKEDKEGYFSRLAETVNTVIEVDLPATIDIEFPTIAKIKKLFSVVADSVPFTPNISQLAMQVGTTRPSLLTYLEALGRAQAILMVDKGSAGYEETRQTGENIFRQPQLRLCLRQPESGYGQSSGDILSFDATSDGEGRLFG